MISRILKLFLYSFPPVLSILFAMIILIAFSRGFFFRLNTVSVKVDLSILKVKMNVKKVYVKEH